MTDHFRCLGSFYFSWGATRSVLGYELETTWLSSAVACVYIKVFNSFITTLLYLSWLTLGIKNKVLPLWYVSVDVMRSSDFPFLHTN